jgi:Flp pilus assembly pilin Flp
MVEYLVKRVQGVLRNEEGIETLEWIAIAVLIVIGVAFALYAGPLRTAVSGAISDVATHLSSGS